MNDLVDLIDFIQKTKFKSNTLLEALIKPSSQLGKIYFAIAQGEARSDQELLALFPELGDIAKITTLKTRLKNRLCDAVFLLDFREESHPDRQTAFVECVKKWSSAMILITKNIRSIGVKQLENLLRHTLDFEFTELSMNVIRTLELYYGTIEGDQRKYSELEVQLTELEATWLAERETERLYSDLVINYVNSRADKHLAAQKAEEYFARIAPYTKQFDAFKIHFFSYLIQTIIYDSRNDYAGMKRVCIQAIDFFEGKKYRSGMVLQTFYYNIITCCLYTRQFEKGQPYVQVLEEMLEHTSFNWFKLQELYVTMAMHTENYRVAAETLAKVQASPHLQAQPAHIAEFWKIVEAYIYYLSITGELDTTGIGNGLTGGFKVSRFLNEVPILSKDKRGMNITVQIIQFLIYLAQKRLDDCESRVDALKKYCLRYLSGENALRSRYFIKMLIQIPLYSFDIHLIRQKTTDTLHLLLEIPWDSVNQHREIEIIPYETLWPIALRSIDKSFMTGSQKLIEGMPAKSPPGPALGTDGAPSQNAGRRSCQ